MNKTLQCKSIPDRPIIEYLAAHQGQWAMRWPWTEDSAFPRGEYVTVCDAMPPDLPEKLVLAKMRQLIRRGLADGCTCGCRGDFEITPKGLEWLAAHDREMEGRSDGQ